MAAHDLLERATRDCSQNTSISRFVTVGARITLPSTGRTPPRPDPKRGVLQQESAHPRAHRREHVVVEIEGGGSFPASRSVYTKPACTSDDLALANPPVGRDCAEWA
jgi:hypothetical protein